MIDRFWNGFQIILFGRFVWLNAYGFGIGRVGGWQFIVYRRKGWRFERA